MNARDADGDTALMFATFNGHFLRLCCSNCFSNYAYFMNVVMDGICSAMR